MTDIVFDSNVCLDFLSVHNLEEAAAKGDDVAYRRQRSRAAWTAVLAVSEYGMRVVGIHEMFAILKKKVPREDQEFHTAYTTVVVNRLLDHVLLGQFVCVDTDAASNRADQFLVEYAHTHQLDMLSAEVSNKAGGVRRTAAELGFTRLYQPAEWLEVHGFSDTTALRHSFLRKAMGAYLQKLRNPKLEEDVKRVLRWLLE